MPVMGKLSKQFYEKFGEQVTNELVDWFNQVDATYRSDLREFNELNFARSDAKMEQRLAEFSMASDRRLARLEARFSALESQFAELRADFSRLERGMKDRFETMQAQLNGAIAVQKASLIKWMVGIYLASMISMAALLRLVG